MVTAKKIHNSGAGLLNETSDRPPLELLRDIAGEPQEVKPFLQMGADVFLRHAGRLSVVLLARGELGFARSGRMIGRRAKKWGLGKI